MCLRQAEASLTYERKPKKEKPIKGNIRCYLVNMLCIYIWFNTYVCDRGQIPMLVQA